MDLPGPLSISSLRPASSSDLSLRPFQRVTAQILAVTGTTAVLALDGHPVVVQLTSAEQATALLSQRTAQFTVTKLTDQEITLKFLRHAQAQPSTATSNPRRPELAVRLLEQNNIPLNSNNLLLARSVLNQGLSLTPGLLAELLAELSGLGNWDQSQAELAAALKAAGLPVTSESLTVASRQAAQTGEALGKLISQLQTTGQNLPPDLLKLLRQNLQMLEQLVLNADGDIAKLAAQLQSAVEVLGQSLESALLEQAEKPETHSMEKSLLSLVRLGQSLEQAGETELAAAVEKFLGDLRHHQFLNAKPEPGPGREAWLEVGFRLGGERNGTARLRIRRESGSIPPEIDPAFTRLVLQVDLSESETVEVDLTLAGKQLRAQVTAPQAVWCQRAEIELLSLEQALQGLGYSLKETSIITAQPQPFERLKLSSGNAPLMTVNIEA